MDRGWDKSMESVARLLNHLRVDQNLHRRTLGIILGLMHIARKGEDPHAAISRMVECLSLELGFENMSFLEYDHERECLRLEAAKGVVDYLEVEGLREFNKDLCIARPDSVAWRVFSSKEPLFVEDTSVDAFPLLRGTSVSIRSMACLPLGEVGVLNFSSSCPMRFSISLRRDLIIITELMANLMETLKFRGQAEVSNPAYVQRVIEARTRELVKSKQEIRHVLELFDSMIHGIPQGLTLLDQDGMLYSVNDALCAMTKATHKDLLQSPFHVLLQRRSDIEAVEKAVRQGKILKLSTGMLKSLEGELVPVDIFFHPLSLKGHGIGGMLVFHDLRGERQRLEEMIEIEKMEALSKMAKGVAHDFNNILTMVLGNIEILNAETKDNEHRARLARIHDAVMEGARIVECLNTYVGRDDGGRKGVTQNLPIIVGQALDLLGPRLRELRECQGVNIQISLNVKDVGAVLMDPEALRDVLVNILLNALEAMPDGGAVTVTTKEAGDRVEIEIEDIGVGISEKDRDKIFDPFYTTKGVRASGLGLCVSKGMLQEYGGNISFESEEGKGTRFIITIPMEERGRAMPHEQPEDSGKRSQSRGPGLKILVVDDEFIIVELLTTLLNGLGHEVTDVADPEEAVKILESETFDLVITDLGMPAMSGFDLAGIVKGHSPDTRVVLITGWGAEYRNQDLKERGVDGVLGKPFKLAELSRLIDKLFRA